MLTVLETECETNARKLQVGLWLSARDPFRQLSFEQEIFDSLPASPHLCIWQPLPALIVTSAEARQPAFRIAAERARNRGLPVHVRRSGGGAVCLGPGMLVVSHVYSSADNDIDSDYRAFAEAITSAVACMGVGLSQERVCDAYCDGKFDLAVRGLKVGGIAQRRRLLDPMTRVWIHAVLAVERESLIRPRAVADFYSDMQSQRIADPRRTTCLAECLAPDVSQQGLMQRCADAIVGAISSRASPPRFAE